jgi:hypothetical protein
MPLTDKVLAVLSMALVVVFLGILVWWVREPDLIIVVVVVCAMAIVDFWKGAGHDQNISIHKE